MSDQYFSDQKYKYLSPAENARLCQISKKRTGDGSNLSPPPSIINQVKINISELKVTLRDLEKMMDPSDEDKVFSSDDDNIKFNARNSVLNRQPTSRNRGKNGGV